MERITHDPQILGGQAAIRGTRVPVATIVRCVASGMSVSEIIDAYPELTPEDIKGALEYAAQLAEERVLPLRPTGT